MEIKDNRLQLNQSEREAFCLGMIAEKVRQDGMMRMCPTQVRHVITMLNVVLHMNSEDIAKIVDLAVIVRRMQPAVAEIEAGNPALAQSILDAVSKPEN